ncbi:hypothetical protein ACWIT3_08835 [Pasteurella sp. P03HT]
MKKKKHGLTGKRNAAKENPANAIINLRVTDDFKNKVAEKAQSENKTITKFVIDIVEKHIE